MLSQEERRIAVLLDYMSQDAKQAASQVGMLCDRVSVILQRAKSPMGNMSDVTRTVLKQKAAGIEAELENIYKLIDKIREL